MSPSPLGSPPGYVAHTVETLPALLASVAAVRQRLGGNASDWRVEEVGDGNLNLAFIARGLRTAWPAA